VTAPSSHTKVAIAVLIDVATITASSIETSFNYGTAVESDFNNVYLGCAGSVNKWAIGANSPESVHVLDTSLSSGRIAGYYFSSPDFVLKPAQIFFMNGKIYGTGIVKSVVRVSLFRMDADGTNLISMRTTGFYVWPMAFVGQANTYAVIVGDYEPNEY
jgi:hypothetical protein